MKKVQRRGAAVALLGLAVIALLALYVVRYVRDGGDWASFVSNGDAYVSGKLRAGTVTDRDGYVLYSVTDGQASYAQDEVIRRATLHTVGDTGRNIGSGAIYKYAGRILDYDPVNGIYSYDGRGGTFTMSIDAQVCKAAYEAIGDRRGAVFIMDYITGEVICAVSTPSFDPQSPPEIAADDTSGVYLNRSISATFTPGSVFKLVTLAAAIENIDDLFDRTFHCDGSIQVGSDTVTCTGRHGDMRIQDALANSCNSVFGELALELGGETLAEYAERYGLTERIDIDSIRTAAGRFDAAEDGSVFLAWSGVGQYNDLMCPAAMARLCAAIANEGKVPALTQVKDEMRLGVEYQRIMRATTASEIAKMMDYAVKHTYGEENFPGLAIRAKSGTAEVGAESPNAWFVGFLEDPEHPYAFAVCLEQAGSGAGKAGPVANAALQEAVK